MAFRFRLESLYKIRKQEEREAEIELGRLRQLQYQLIQRREELQKEQNRWIDTYSEEGMKQDASSQLLTIERYLIALDGESQKRQREMMLLSKDIEKAIMKVEERYRSRKQIEHLRDKMKGEYEELIQQKERKDTAEMTLLRFVRGQQEEVTL